MNVELNEILESIEWITSEISMYRDDGDPLLEECREAKIKLFNIITKLENDK